MEPLRREPTPAEREVLRRRLLARPMPAFDLALDAQHNGAVFGALAALGAVIAAFAGVLHAGWILPVAFAGSLFGGVITAIDAVLHRRAWVREQARLRTGRQAVGPVEEYRLEATAVVRVRHPESGVPAVVVVRPDGRLQLVAGPPALDLTARPEFPTRVMDLVWSADHGLPVGARLSGEPVPLEEQVGELAATTAGTASPLSEPFDGSLATCLEDWAHRGETTGASQRNP